MTAKKKFLFALGIDGLLISGAIFLKLFIADIMDIFPECYIAVVGRQCGSCGGTRCVRQILNGNFVEAFNLNPYFFVVFCYAVMLITLLNLAWLFKINGLEKFLIKLANYKVIIAFAVAYLLFSVWRLFLS